MSLKRNILASYATQIYVTLVGILILPLYLKYMGAEAYGLVGFFTMLQAWFNLLDMGLTPTVARETARFHGGATNALSYRRLLRALQLIFFAIALLGGGAMFVFSGVIADRWLNVQTLPLAQVQLALQLMAVGVAMRWMSGLYRGCISGSERLVWLGGFNAFVATLRFVGVLPVLIWVGHSPTVFFTYQLLVAVVELAGLAAKSYRLFPAVPQGQLLGWSPANLFAPIKPVLKFSLSIAFTSSVWVLVTQTDKLVLSKILPLAEYGYFTVAVLVASGIMMVGGPISSALMPRMTRLQAEGQHGALIALYRQATQLVTVIAIPSALVLIFFAPQVLWAWTGDAALVSKAAPVLRLYAIGYAFLAVGAFPYYLQYAKGQLRLHLIGNALFVLILIPSVIWAATHHGMTGAGWAWLASNAGYFFLWAPLVHSKFMPGKHMKWLWIDIFLPVLLPISFAALAAKYFQWSSSRIWISVELVAIAAILFTPTIILTIKNSTATKKLKMHTKITPSPANSTPTPTPKISICLITYNQKQYIRDALDGILMQKTNFYYELIIHDDASSDGTTEILKEYQAKHGDKIKLIIASANKYSKVGFEFIGEIFSFAKGEYISICEGDDYWTDPLKLQKQVTILDSNKKYAISIHNAYRLNCENNQQTPFNAKKLPQNMGIRDVLLRGWFSPTASFVFRKENVAVPSTKDASLDMIILYQNAKHGRIHYSEDISSVYRYAALNSLTEKYKKNKIELYKRKLRFINYVDKTSHGKYLAYTLIARFKVFASMALNSI